MHFAELYLSICLSIYLSICLAASFKAKLFQVLAVPQVAPSLQQVLPLVPLPVQQVASLLVARGTDHLWAWAVFELVLDQTAA